MQVKTCYIFLFCTKNKFNKLNSIETDVIRGLGTDYKTDYCRNVN